MADMIPTKPYLVRAIHEWCVDNALTPHLLVSVNAKCRVPMAYVKEGEIVLNLNYSATKDLHIDNDVITFSARFGGISQNLYVPMHAVKGIFARENSQGMFFEIEEPAFDSGADETKLPVVSEAQKTAEQTTTVKKKSHLTVVK